MTSRRLTTAMRGVICENAIIHRFSPDVKKLVDQFRDLADEAYEKTYGGISGQMIALPKGWLPQVATCSYRFGSEYVGLKFSGSFASRYHSSPTIALAPLQGEISDIWRLVPSDKNGQCHATFDARDELSIIYAMLQDTSATLNNLVVATRRDLIVTLEKFTTVEKLLEGWPEIEPFTVGVTPAPKTNLPAVPVAALNTLLGLPV